MRMFRDHSFRLNGLKRNREVLNEHFVLLEEADETIAYDILIPDLLLEFRQELE